MANTPLRILRRLVREIDPAPRPLTAKQSDQRDRILRVGLVRLAQHGLHAMRFSSFAYALGYSPQMVRKHFCDLDELLGAILRTHLHRLSQAMEAVPDDAPDRRAAQRAAYVAITRNGDGGFTDAHLLLVRDGHMLPPDELDPIEATLSLLGQTLGGGEGPAVLSLLDNPCFTIGQIEAVLAAVFPAGGERQAPQARPATPPPRPAVLH